MIEVVVGLLVGAAVAAALWASTDQLFESPALQRTNYRGRSLPTGVGLLVPTSVLLVAAVARTALLAAERSPAWDQLVGATLVAVLGFGLLGLVDDVVGEGQSGGFRGHLRDLARGHLTSGALKMVGGAAVGLLVAAPLGTGDGGAVGALRDGAIVALAANLANLLDRAPGRAVKVTALVFVVAAAVSRSVTLTAPAVGMGAGLGLLPADLGERAMLGDAGANPLGAMCGLALLCAVPGDGPRWAVVAVLGALNLLSEKVSFSRAIDVVAPLRWFDRLGRQG